jgi:hypothetical protein
MIRTKVELFSSDELDYLESQMNAWMADNPDINIIDVKFSGQAAPIELEPYFKIVYTGMVFYTRSVL